MKRLPDSDQSSVMEQLAEARARMRARYEAEQLKARLAAEAAQLEKEKAALDAQRAQRLAELEEKARLMSIPVFAAIFTIQRWMRQHRGKVRKSHLIRMDEQMYSVDEALQMQSGGIFPFNTQEGERAIDAYYTRTQRWEFAVSEARDFKKKDLHSILLTMWINTCSLSIEGKLIPCMEHGLLDVIPIQDFTEMFRRPFMEKDFPLENAFARWFRVYTALQDELPEWLPIGAEVYMAQAYDKMVDILETIRQRNLKKMEVEQEPLPEDEVQCCGCPTKTEYKNLFKKEGGCLAFCRYCAVQVGIQVPPPVWDTPPNSPRELSDEELSAIAPESPRELEVDQDFSDAE